MKASHAWAGLALALLGAACVNTSFMPTTTLALPARAENCHLDIILDGLPPAPYAVIGRISTDSTAPGMFALGESNQAATDRLREEACRVGAHGLLNVGTASQGTWTNNGYS